MTSTLRTGLIVTAAVGCLATAQMLDAVALDERASWPRTEDYAAFLPPPEASPVIFAGFREVAADIYWVRVLVYYGTSLVGEADYKYLEQFIDNIIVLDPHFERAYSWAMRAVTYKHTTATQEEFQQSLAYARRGMEQFPDSYEFFFEAGILCTHDIWVEDPAELRRYRELGAEYIDRAARKKDAPRNLATLAASLRTKLGQKERALRNLHEMILLTENEKAREKLLQQYRRIAEQEFPEEARTAMEELEAAWKRETPFAGPSMYILLGDRPSPVIDFDRLATDRDLFGVAQESQASQPASSSTESATR